jgi:hypothetical protein
MNDSELLDRFRKFYDSPEADNETVLQETEARFLRQPWELRKVFVDGLEQEMLNDEIGIRERAERLSIHRRFNNIHQSLKRLGR